MSSLVFERAIVWLRRDLRLKDHRAFYEATHTSKKVLPIFIIDENIIGKLPKNDRRITFIQKSLDEISNGLEKKESTLLIMHGNPSELIPAIVKKYKIQAVFANHDYEPVAKNRDAEIENKLKAAGVKFQTFKDQVIFERKEILNGSGDPYRVFTPYSNNWLKKFEMNKKIHLKDYQPRMENLWPASEVQDQSISFWKLGFIEQKLVVTPGEKAAHQALKKFTSLVSQYKTLRDFPSKASTSKLSVHLRFGTISIRELMRFADEQLSVGTKIWIKELIWREFYQMILDQYPHVVSGCFKTECDKIKWPGKREHFQMWCDGMTGYPIVDAAMREFKQTGWMHNRLRMVVAMFLTKDLLLDWKLGEKYFSENLLDYDLASNNGGWQWSASTGCDAQPYFRVMNPISQSERFDFDGEYIKKWIPELKLLNSKQIHWPHEDEFFSKSIHEYPKPIVEHSIQRIKAISLFKK